jgi:glycine/D-amino acid oxidase-like deaminating enzyme
MADIELILIVGGGIAGLSVATALHRQSFHPELVEHSMACPAIGAGIRLPLVVSSGSALNWSIPNVEPALIKGAGLGRGWMDVQQSVRPE